MKRLLTIMLFLIHTVTHAGTVLNVHYCMGNLAAVSIGDQEDEACTFCGMTDESCCHDEPQVIKADNTAYLGSFMPKVDFSLPVFVAGYNKITPASFSNVNILNRKNISIPGTPPIYLKNCVIRI